ncbi:hypothetical protein HJG60_009111 [Phyllostomus discolor]|uniref:Uncharacterized protein n=1 Tax=Phyllostomus discolor TaxID=89673 RepID=A0A833YM96_9CHIR|nr:hypothetical protein HJG60_009111 [Phyllostomus discolor]
MKECGSSACVSRKPLTLQTCPCAQFFVPFQGVGDPPPLSCIECVFSPCVVFFVRGSLGTTAGLTQALGPSVLGGLVGCALGHAQLCVPTSFHQNHSPCAPCPPSRSGPAWGSDVLREGFHHRLCSLLNLGTSTRTGTCLLSLLPPWEKKTSIASACVVQELDIGDRDSPTRGSKITEM